ncbi:MAG TPA: 50S ribosomal protein L29 [Candidatus Nanoarchaeia archaeon]|nr:50S ribosomal protein L29 [Candidatus Nanoarchaeia archaeon]
MKYAEIKGKDQKTLVDMLKDKQNALRAFTFGTAGSKSRNVKEGNNIKKDIARIMTEMNKK